MVRIVDDFWENYNEYQEVIIKSIYHITKKQFPNPDPQGQKEDINHVIYELYRLKIFKKWNDKRLTAKNRTKRQQFENYLYQRIWAILFNEYHRRKKRTVRFKKYPSVGKFFSTDSIHKDTWKTPDNMLYNNGKMNDLKPNHNPQEEERLQHLRATKQPTIKNIGEICSIPDYADESIETKETLNQIIKLCKSKKEKMIILLKQQGYNNKEIGHELNITGQYVADILNLIQKKYSEKVF